MSVSPGRSLLIILVVAAVTLVTRALPFLLFRNPERTPRAVVYLGKVLPPATMAMLVVYCLKGVSVALRPARAHRGGGGGVAASVETEQPAVDMRGYGAVYGADTGRIPIEKNLRYR